MQPSPSYAHEKQREKLAKGIQAFLDNGGTIERLPDGVVTDGGPTCWDKTKKLRDRARKRGQASANGQA